MQLEALSVLSHAREPVLWVWKSRKDTGNALEAPEPETERTESWFAGFSYTEGTVTGLLQISGGGRVFNLQTCVNSSTWGPP